MDAAVVVARNATSDNSTNVRTWASAIVKGQSEVKVKKPRDTRQGKKRKTKENKIGQGQSTPNRYHEKWPSLYANETQGQAATIKGQLEQ